MYSFLRFHLTSNPNSKKFLNLRKTLFANYCTKKVLGIRISKHAFRGWKTLREFLGFLRLMVPDCPFLGSNKAIALSFWKCCCQFLWLIILVTPMNYHKKSHLFLGATFATLSRFLRFSNSCKKINFPFRFPCNAGGLCQTKLTLVSSFTTKIILWSGNGCGSCSKPTFPFKSFKRFKLCKNLEHLPNLPHKFRPNSYRSPTILSRSC